MTPIEWCNNILNKQILPIKWKNKTKQKQEKTNITNKQKQNKTNKKNLNSN